VASPPMHPSLPSAGVGVRKLRWVV
jgi:hypothetical protein